MGMPESPETTLRRSRFLCGAGLLLQVRRLGELLNVPHPPLQNRRDGRIGLPLLLRLVRYDRRLHETADHAFQREVGALELGSMVDRASWTHFAAEAAIHALGNVDVKAAEDHLFGLLVFFHVNDNAIDRTSALARETAGADLQINFQNATIAKWQSILHADRHPVGVLNRVRFAHEVREGDAHALEDRPYRLFDVLKISAHAGARHTQLPKLPGCSTTPAGRAAGGSALA